jgi:hypothetical protein
MNKYIGFDIDSKKTVVCRAKREKRQIRNL